MTQNPPDAMLLIAPGCAHCPLVLEGLTRLLKNGKLGRLEVVNIMVHPEIGRQVGTRSVPWCRIGPFELEGAQSSTALSKWTEHAAAGTGLSEYYAHLLETQRPHRVAELITRQPDSFDGLLGLLEDSDTPMTVRIGIGVVLEDLQNNPLLLHALPVLTRLADSAAANVRADAAHYLGLTRAPEAAVVLERLLTDENPDVREIAAESIDQLAPAD
jgi:hypothetical protein